MRQRRREGLGPIVQVDQIALLVGGDRTPFDHHGAHGRWRWRDMRHSSSRQQRGPAGALGTRTAAGEIDEGGTQAPRRRRRADGRTRRAGGGSTSPSLATPADDAWRAARGRPRSAPGSARFSRLEVVELVPRARGRRRPCPRHGLGLLQLHVARGAAACVRIITASPGIAPDHRRAAALPADAAREVHQAAHSA